MRTGKSVVATLSFILLVCFIADAVQARRGKEFLGMVNLVGKSFDKLSNDAVNNPPVSSESFGDAKFDGAGTELVAEQEKHLVYASFSEQPAKLQEEMRANPGKKISKFGGSMACICDDQVFFTNVVCMPCADYISSVEESIMKL